MKYIAKHKRIIRGTAVHQTAEEAAKTKKKAAKKAATARNQREAALEGAESGAELRHVETKYLIPNVERWVETDSIKDVKERVKSWLSLKYPVHIIGPTGCGKTTLAMQVAKELGRPVVWINGDESVTTTDLIGGYSQIEVESVRDKYVHNVFKDKDILKAEWVDNPLTLACKYGYILIYNEFSRSKAVANNVLLSIFSEGILELPTKFGEERYVKVHPDFRAIFTSNSVEYAGVHRAQDALLDRMVGIYMDYYDIETEAKIIAAHSRIGDEAAHMLAKMLDSVRKQLPEGGCIGTRAGVMIARAIDSDKTFSKSLAKQLLADVITSKTKNLVQYQEQMGIIEAIRF